MKSVYLVRKLTWNVTPFQASCKPQLTWHWWEISRLYWILPASQFYKIHTYTYKTILNTPCKYKLQVGFREARARAHTHTHTHKKLMLIFLCSFFPGEVEAFHKASLIFDFVLGICVMLLYQQPPCVVWGNYTELVAVEITSRLFATRSAEPKDTQYYCQVDALCSHGYAQLLNGNQHCSLATFRRKQKSRLLKSYFCGFPKI